MIVEVFVPERYPGGTARSGYRSPLAPLARRRPWRRPSTWPGVHPRRCHHRRQQRRAGRRLFGGGGARTPLCYPSIAPHAHHGQQRQLWPPGIESFVMKKRYLISKVALAMGAALALMASSAQAIVIDNGIPIGTVGHWSVDVLTGGAVGGVMFTTQRYDSTEVVTEDFVSTYKAFVDPGIDGGGFQLNGSDPVGDSIDPNMVLSPGTFVGV